MEGMSMHVYSNNGLTMRLAEPSYQVCEGEACFSDPATADQLTQAFPGYAAAIQAQQAAASKATTKSAKGGK
jgi:hypothetical protein